MGSQATVKEGMVKKDKSKVAVKIYNVRLSDSASACALSTARAASDA